MMCLWAQLCRYARLPNFPCYCFGCSYEELLDYIDAHCKVESPLKKCPGIINYKMLKRLWEPGSLYIDFLQRGSESVSLFHLFHLFIDWSGTCVSSLVLVWLLGVVFLLFCLVCFVWRFWPFILIEVSNNDYFSTASWATVVMTSAALFKKKNCVCVSEFVLLEHLVVLTIATRTAHRSFCRILCEQHRWTFRLKLATTTYNRSLTGMSTAIKPSVWLVNPRTCFEI